MCIQVVFFSFVFRVLIWKCKGYGEGNKKGGREKGNGTKGRKGEEKRDES